jgi:hypothetical protein
MYKYFQQLVYLPMHFSLKFSNLEHVKYLNLVNDKMKHYDVSKLNIFSFLTDFILSVICEIMEVYKYAWFSLCNAAV